jgi:hypothetical protein
MATRHMSWFTPRTLTMSSETRTFSHVTMPFWRPDPQEQRELNVKYGPNLVTYLAGRFFAYIFLKTHYPREFREGAKQAFFRIAELLNRGDVEELSPLLGDELMQEIRRTLEGLKQEGIQWELAVSELINMKVVGIYIRLGPTPRPNYTYTRLFGQELVFPVTTDRKLERPSTIPVIPLEGHVQIHVAYVTKECSKLVGDHVNIELGPHGVHVLKFESPMNLKQSLEETALSWKITDIDYYLSAKKDSMQQKSMPIKEEEAAPIENVIKSKKNDLRK